MQPSEDNGRFPQAKTIITQKVDARPSEPKRLLVNMSTSLLSP